MQEMELKLDMYSIFDRIGEGVMFKYKVKYDWDSIIKDDANEQNFVVEAIGFGSDTQKYLGTYHMSVEQWTKDAIEYLTQDENNVARENFFENLSDELYDEYSDARNF